MKLFKVTKKECPEWGHDRVLFTKYYTASCLETVESVVRDRFGKLKSWDNDERCEIIIDIEEMKAEEL